MAQGEGGYETPSLLRQPYSIADRQRKQVTYMVTSLEINDQFKQAIDIVEHSQASVFITGKAGTGKSTLLRHIVQTTKKNLAVTAPTGIAALNVGGMTIHSFFGFPLRIVTGLHFPAPHKQSVMRQIQTLVIDEVSMVRADVLDAIDRTLRVVRKSKEPFGGVQVVMFGDLHQLPPVVTPDEERAFATLYASPFFFAAQVMREHPMTRITLTKVYRQADDRFITLLNHVRENRCTESDLQELNACAQAKEQPGKQYVTIATTNAIARAINMQHLNALPGRLQSYVARITGAFDPGSYPTEMAMMLKKNAQVMFLRNDPERRWVNGTIGTVESLSDSGVRVRVGAELHDVEPVQWDKIEYQAGKDTIDSKIVGTFSQIPLKLAWAITIHKSQGQTFDNVVINLGAGTFAHGQLYVALSRCTALEGIILSRPIEQTDVIFDERVLAYA